MFYSKILVHFNISGGNINNQGSTGVLNDVSINQFSTFEPETMTDRAITDILQTLYGMTCL